MKLDDLVKYVQNWFGPFCLCFPVFIFLSLSSVPVAQLTPIQQNMVPWMSVAQVIPKFKTEHNW